MSDRPSFNISDLKKLYATSSNAENSTKLCYSQKEVLIKPMKVKDKKEVLKAIESKKENLINKALDNIIEKYVEPVDGSEFEVAKLTTQERHQILVHIRVAAAGDTAKIVHECPNCRHLNKYIEFNLNSLYIQPYKEPNTGNTIDVLNGAIRIHLNPINRETEMQIESYIKRNKIETTSEKNFALMAGVIGKVEMNQDDFIGEVKMSIDEKIEFFENLSSTEFDKITDYFKQIDFGVKMPFDFKCEKCGHEEEQEVDVAVFFIS